MDKGRHQARRVLKMRRASLVLIVSGLLMLTAAVVLVNRQARIFEPGSGILQLAVAEFDFGDVSVSGGPVSTELPLANSGKNDLVILLLETTCDCLIVRLIAHGVSGPEFSRSSLAASGRSWQLPIAPGEQALLQVRYDPVLLSNLRGPAIRVITITSSQKFPPVHQIRIRVNQVD